MTLSRGDNSYQPCQWETHHKHHPTSNPGVLKTFCTREETQLFMFRFCCRISNTLVLHGGQGQGSLPTFNLVCLGLQVQHKGNGRWTGLTSLSGRVKASSGTWFCLSWSDQRLETSKLGGSVQLYQHINITDTAQHAAPCSETPSDDSKSLPRATSPPYQTPGAPRRCGLSTWHWLYWWQGRSWWQTASQAASSPCIHRSLSTGNSLQTHQRALETTVNGGGRKTSVLPFISIFQKAK